MLVPRSLVSLITITFSPWSCLSTAPPMTSQTLNLAAHRQGLGLQPFIWEMVGYCNPIITLSMCS